MHFRLSSIKQTTKLQNGLKGKQTEINEIQEKEFYSLTSFQTFYLQSFLSVLFLSYSSAVRFSKSGTEGAAAFLQFGRVEFYDIPPRWGISSKIG